MADHSAVRAELQAQLGKLLKRAREIEGDLLEPGSRDTLKSAMESNDIEVLASNYDTLRGEIAEIRLAIDLIDNNRYGRCTICHKEISPALLAMIPYATRCVACDMSSSKS